MKCPLSLKNSSGLSSCLSLIILEYRGCRFRLQCTLFLGVSFFFLNGSIHASDSQQIHSGQSSAFSSSSGVNLCVKREQKWIWVVFILLGNWLDKTVVDRQCPWNSLILGERRLGFQAHSAAEYVCDLESGILPSSRLCTGCPPRFPVALVL